MVDPLVVLAPHAKADDAEDFVHDGGDVGAHVTDDGVGQNGLVSAGDVVADPGRADLVAVRHDAADRHGVSQVMVGHQGYAIRGAGAVLDLTTRSLVYRGAQDVTSSVYLHLR